MITQIKILDMHKYWNTNIKFDMQTQIYEDEGIETMYEFIVCMYVRLL